MNDLYEKMKRCADAAMGGGLDDGDWSVKAKDTIENGVSTGDRYLIVAGEPPRYGHTIVNPVCGFNEPHRENLAKHIAASCPKNVLRLIESHEFELKTKAKLQQDIREVRGERNELEAENERLRKTLKDYIDETGIGTTALPDYEPTGGGMEAEVADLKAKLDKAVAGLDAIGYDDDLEHSASGLARQILEAIRSDE